MTMTIRMLPRSTLNMRFAPRASIKGSVSAKFPASVTGESPIDVTNNGGDYSISIDTDQLIADIIGVVLPVTSTDNAITRFDGIVGHIQNSGVTLSDLNVVTGAKVLGTGASTARTLEAEFADVINAVRYGAVGDDATDNATAFALIKTACGTGGKKVVFPPGVYRSSATWDMSSLVNVVVEGAGGHDPNATFGFTGTKGTVLKFTHSGTGNIINLAGHVGVWFRDLVVCYVSDTLTGTGLDLNSPSPAVGNGSGFERVQFYQVTNSGHNLNRWFYLKNCNDVTFRDVVVSHADYGWVGLENADVGETNMIKLIGCQSIALGVAAIVNPTSGWSLDAHNFEPTDGLAACGIIAGGSHVITGLALNNCVFADISAGGTWINLPNQVFNFSMIGGSIQTLGGASIGAQFSSVFNSGISFIGVEFAGIAPTATFTAINFNGTANNGVVVIGCTFIGVTAGIAGKSTCDSGSLFMANNPGTENSPIAVLYGGTGLQTYTVGDIIYASNTSTFSKLIGVATGNALISGGVATAPSWGKIGLATHVSGNLPVTNLNSGTSASSSTFWRGDGTWAAASGGGGTVTSITASTGITLSPNPIVATGTVAITNTAVTAASYGSATVSPTYTVNAQGQLTAAADVTITPAVGSVTGLGSGVATFLATPSSANFAAAVTGETGTGAVTFATSPTFTTDITINAAAGGSIAVEKINASVAGTIAGITWQDAATSKWTIYKSTANDFRVNDVVNNVDMMIFSQGLVSAGSVSFPNTLDASSSTVAAVKVVGGLAVAKKANIGTDLAVGGHITTEGVTATGATGTGKFVFDTSPTLVTPALGTPSALVLTNATGLPVSSGIIGLGTGVATALAVNVGSAGAFVTFNGALGTPSSGTVTNLTGTASININGTVGATSQNTGQFTSLAYSTTLTGTSANASALAVGRLGATTPALQIDASTATSITGVKIKSAATGGGVAISAIGETNVALTIDGAGSGTITLGGTSTGAITLTRATTMSAALTYGGVALNNAVTGTGNMVLSTSPTLTTPALGTPSAIVLTSGTGLPISTGVSGLGTGVATALAVNVGSAGAFVTFNGALGTPSSGTLTNCTGLPVAGGGTGIASYAVGDIIYASGSTTLSKLADVATGNALISGGVTTAPAWGKIGLTTHVSGILPEANGGTNQSTYATGDLLQASATNTLSKLAAVATGNALISGGVTTASSWGKIGLTTHVSGVLPEANGGTNQSTYALGDIIYSSATNTLSKLAGNTAATFKVLAQTGTGSVSAAPAWVAARETLTANRTYYVATTGSDSNTGLATATTSAVTFTNGSPNIGWTGHGRSVGNTFVLTTSGTLPTNFALLTVYYVASVVDVNTITAEVVAGGADTSAGSAGSGTHTATVLSPFLTIQFAINTVAGLDEATFVSTVNVAGGTYTGSVRLPELVGGSPSAAARAVITGNVTTPGNCIISTTSTTAVATNPGAVGWKIEGFKVQTTTAGHAVDADRNSEILVGAMEFGAVAAFYSHVHCANNSRVWLIAALTLSGGGYTHILAEDGGRVQNSNVAYTLTGTPAFAFCFVGSVRGSGVVANSSTYSGAATGQRWNAAMNGIIETFSSASATFFPGNSNGAFSSGGQYD